MIKTTNFEYNEDNIFKMVRKNFNTFLFFALFANKYYQFTKKLMPFFCFFYLLYIFKKTLQKFRITSYDADLFSTKKLSHS